MPLKVELTTKSSNNQSQESDTQQLEVEMSRKVIDEGRIPTHEENIQAHENLAPKPPVISVYRRRRNNNLGNVDPADVRDYQLTRDRVPRPRGSPNMYGFSEMVYFALNIVEYLESYEPDGYQQAICCKEKDKW